MNQHPSIHRRNKEISEIPTRAVKKKHCDFSELWGPTKPWDELEPSHLGEVHNLSPCIKIAFKIQGLNTCPISSLLKVRSYFMSQLIFVRNKAQAASPVFPEGGGRGGGVSRGSRGHAQRAEAVFLGSRHGGTPRH